MKTVIVVFALCALACAYPRPKEDSKEDESGERGETKLFVVPLSRSPARRPFAGFLPEDLMPPPLEQHPFFRSNPWDEEVGAGRPQVDDFMTQMQEMLREMRKQLTELIQHSHPAGDLPDNTSVGTRIGDDDLPKNKSTSTTKVIDGHVVTVNETTYSSGDDNIGAVFRIKVVEVKPSEDPEIENAGEDKIGGTDESENTEGPQPEHEPTTSKSELEEDKHEETNEIPNMKVGSEVDDLIA